MTVGGRSLLWPGWRRRNRATDYPPFAVAPMLTRYGAITAWNHWPQQRTLWKNDVPEAIVAPTVLVPVN